MVIATAKAVDTNSLWIISSLGLNPEYLLHSMHTCEWQLLKRKIPTGITQLWVYRHFCSRAEIMLMAVE
jgi:hypothetical protein